MNLELKFDTLVSASWVKQHLDSPGMRLVEVRARTGVGTDVMPGAVVLHARVLRHACRRDIVSKADFQLLMGNIGLSPDETLVLYSDDIAIACHAHWILKTYAHADVRILNGARPSWRTDGAMPGRPSSPGPTIYAAPDPDFSQRAFIDEVLAGIRSDEVAFIDVRPERTDAPTGGPREPMPGRIPGALRCPARSALAPDGTLLPVEDLRRIFIDDLALDPTSPAIVYGQTGEDSAITWFVLTQLLGFRDVRNYDGGWLEYGSMIGLDIETDEVSGTT